MTDWFSSLPPEERVQWDEFVEHFRRDALGKIAGSAAFVSLVPSGDGDVKFWAELGCAVMLDKPLLAIVQPGATISGKLRAIADEIVQADVDTEAGRDAVAVAVRRLMPVRRS